VSLRLINTEFDGYRWAICARGSWTPLMVFQSLAEAMEAQS
jgi:hypothetical protein